MKRKGGIVHTLCRVLPWASATLWLRSWVGWALLWAVKMCWLQAIARTCCMHSGQVWGTNVHTSLSEISAGRGCGWALCAIFSASNRLIHPRCVLTSPHSHFSRRRKGFFSSFPMSVSSPVVTKGGKTHTLFHNIPLKTRVKLFLCTCRLILFVYRFNVKLMVNA